MKEKKTNKNQQPASLNAGDGCMIDKYNTKCAELSGFFCNVAFTHLASGNKIRQWIFTKIHRFYANIQFR